jgi:hypothetical protein
MLVPFGESRINFAFVEDLAEGQGSSDLTSRKTP